MLSELDFRPVQIITVHVTVLINIDQMKTPQIDFTQKMNIFKENFEFLWNEMLTGPHKWQNFYFHQAN